MAHPRPGPTVSRRISPGTEEAHGTCARSGVTSVGALIATVVVLVVLTGALELARASLRESLAFRDVMVAQRLAAGAVRAMGPTPPEGRPWSGPARSWVLSPAHRARVLVRDLDREYVLVEGQGWAGVDSATARVGAVSWRPDAVVRAAELGRGVVAYGGALRAAGRVAEGPVDAAPLGWEPSHCSTWATVVDSLFPTARAPAWLPLATTPDSLPGLGPLAGQELAGLGREVGGRVSPGPVESAGRCDPTDPLNWGDPTHPGAPCGGHRPVVVGRGPLVVSGGVGQGVMVAENGLRLESGHRFLGLILVRGDVDVGAGVRVEGFIRASGSVHIHAEARVEAPLCGILPVLSDLADLIGPVWLPARPWVEPL